MECVQHNLTTLGPHAQSIGNLFSSSLPECYDSGIQHTWGSNANMLPALTGD